MSTKLLTVFFGTVVLLTVCVAPSLYAEVLEPETPPSSTVPQAEPKIVNPPAIDEALQSIRPDEIEKAAASEVHAKTDISAELAKASSPVYPKQ